MQVYTDGSYRDGIGGWAWWCEDTGEHRSGAELGATNQRMELKAALEAVNEHWQDPDLVIISDSAYLVNCFGEKWWIKWFTNDWMSSKGTPLAHRDIWEPLLEMVQAHGNIKFVWVKGHSGVPGNEKVDKLAYKEVVKYGKLKKSAKKNGKSKKRKGSGVRSSDRTADRRKADGLAEADPDRHSEEVTVG